jgi:predicted metalloendopeptidase
MRFRIFFSLVVAAALAAVGAGAQAPATVTIDRATMDTTCSACTDFYSYANGGWLRTAQIPAAKTSLGSFSLLGDRNEEAVHRILEDAAAAATTADLGRALGATDGRGGIAPFPVFPSADRRTATEP